MNVLFLEIDDEGEWAVASIGPASIASYLRQFGHQVSLFQVSRSMSVSQLIQLLQEQSPDILGISLTSRQWLRAKELIPAVREKLDIPIIAGGLHPTFSSGMVLNTPGFDYVCIGEGEQAMLELVEAIDRGEKPQFGIRNIRAEGEPMPQLRPPIEPIDDLPFMARDMLNEKYGVVNVVTQRGCPFSCTYCAARKFNDLYDGGYASYGRRRSPENVLAELVQIRDEGELNYVVFLDDTFTLNHAWVKKFCQLYGEQFHVPFSINARAETVNDSLLKQLSSAGCRHVIYGVESGSERVRREILDRKVSNEKIRRAFQTAQEVGMLATANYMLGVPGETKADIEQTLALHEELQPDDFGYFVFYPYPGTPLFQVCKEKGYLPENYDELKANHRQTILKLPNLTPGDIDYYYDKFTQLRVRDRLRALPEGASSSSQQSVVAQIEESAAHA